MKNTDHNIIFTTTDYGVEFISAVQTETVLATQFHPEKSGNVGLKMLKDLLKSMHDKLIIRGAKEHNLKDIDLDLQKVN